MLFLTRHVGETLAKFSAPLIVGAGTVGTGVYIWLTDGFQTKQKALDLSSQKLSDITQENEKLRATISQRKQTKIQSKERSEQLSQTLQLLKMRAILNYMSQEYSKKISQFQTEKTNLEAKIDENEALKEEITKLESEIKENLTELKTELQKIKNDMPNFYKGTLKTTKYKNFSNIKIHKTTVVKKESEQTSFSGTGKEGTSVNFTIKKDNKLFTLETYINDIKEKGINLTLNTGELKQWNGHFYITESREFWDQKPNSQSTEKATSATHKAEENQKLDIKEIFDTNNENIYHNAVKLLEVMSRIQSITFNQIKNKPTTFEMASGSETNLSNVSSQITKNAWTKSDEQNKWNIKIHSFGNQEDFVKYWIMKTIELTISKKVDLSALLDPIHKKESYSNAKTNA